MESSGSIASYINYDPDPELVRAGLDHEKVPVCADAAAAKYRPMGPMLRLRLYWYRTDKEVWLFALILGGVAALFCMVFWGVFAHQQARQNRTIEAHVQNLDCLARNIYYEARGEPLAGQYAVAEVTMNRKDSR